MPLKLLYTDLTKFPCDAAVFAADESMQAGGSVFGACSSAAGPSLREVLCGLGGCAAGQARIMEHAERFSGLRCRNLIVTAAPVWQGGGQNETALLADCYRNSLDEAAAHGCKKIGIGLIDSGVYGFPKELALETAVQTILAHPLLPSLDVYLIRFDWYSYGEHARTLAGLERYLSERFSPDFPVMNAMIGQAARETGFFRRKKQSLQIDAAYAACESAVSLEERLKQLDEGFPEMLLRLIDEAGMKDSECYKKANVSKQLFSKIRSDPEHRPKKETALAFAIALKLDLDGTNALLRAAGYSLSHSSKFDIIIEYFISKRIYNVFEINEALELYDQKLLGSE